MRATVVLTALNCVSGVLRFAVGAVVWSLLASAALAQEMVVQIGHVAPMSGWLARVGSDSANGARLAIETLNRQGKTIDGRRVVFNLVVADDAGEAGRAIVAAESLVASKVAGVVGHLLSDATIAGAAVYAAAGLPQIAPSATRVAYTRQGWTTAFRVIADDARIGRLLARYAVDEKKAKRFMVIDDRTRYGQDLAEEFSNGVLAAGGQVVGRLRFDEATNDSGDLRAGVVSKNADAVFFGGLDRRAGLLLKQMRRLGFDVLFIGGDAICTPDLVSYWSAGAALDDQVLCALPAGIGDIGEAALTQFAADYRARFGRAAEYYAPYAYDAVMVLADAMVRASSTEPSAVLRALADTSDFRGLTGTIAFDPRGDVRHPAISIFTYRGEERHSIRTLR